MIESVTNYLVGTFEGKVPAALIIFFISLLPVLELRGGMIAAKLLGVGLLKAFVICYLGNILPIPFILTTRMLHGGLPITNTTNKTQWSESTVIPGSLTDMTDKGQDLRCHIPRLALITRNCW